MTMTTTDPGTATGGDTAPAATSTPSVDTPASGIDALRAGIEAPEGTENANPQTPKTNEPDPLDAELDSWSKDGTVPGAAKPASSDPLAGLDPNHPFVQAVMRQAREGEFNKTLTQAMQELVSSGVPRQALPAFREVFQAARQLADENKGLKETLTKVDNSELVKTAQAQKLAGKYGRYGVDVKALMVGIKDPQYTAQDMERLARTLAVINRQNGVKGRADKGSDRFESPRGQGGSRSDIMDMTKPGLDLLRQGVK